MTILPFYVELALVTLKLDDQVGVVIVRPRNMGCKHVNLPHDRTGPDHTILLDG